MGERVEITDEERRLADEILDEGDRKYWEKATTLGELLGVDWLDMPDAAFNRIWKWLKDNRDGRRKEFKRHNLEIRMEDSSSAKIVVRRSERRGDVDELRVSWWNQAGNDVLRHRMTPGEYKSHYNGECTATDAMSYVLTTLRELDLWLTVAMAYKAVRADVDKAEKAKSVARAKKARHQLELLRKL